jgi:2-polyprenyl-6-hydroxyphenyl methylase/3-demethylubiquinone-9 3-methyltransferase
MSTLGSFDVVYSWGVLHHTGNLGDAINAAADRVGDNGLLAIAVYNDQGGGSRRWHAVKRGYHRVPSFLRPGYVVTVAGVYELKFALARLARGGNPLPFADWRSKRDDRGMSVWHDWVDWIGGLPFEVATPEAIIVPLRLQGFVLENLRTVGSGWGCNEYVFQRESMEGSPVAEFGENFGD